MAALGLEMVRGRISDAAVRSGRTEQDVTLVAVSKGRSDAEVQEAYDFGQRIFGENRQQGLAGRTEAGLPDDISWHFIGPLQSRKAAFVATHASLLHSFDRERLITKWQGTGTPVLVQFNVAAEPQKAGFAPSAADEVLSMLLEAGIDVRGVMAIPPLADDSDDTRRWFSLLRGIFEQLRTTEPRIDTLSMGMTNDFEAAIEEGATMVRVGRAIFGDHTDSDRERNG